MKKFVCFVFIFILLNCKKCFAQQTEQIEADRPDQTENPFPIPAKHFQMETGFSFMKNNITDRTIEMPTVLFKYGLTNNFELRLFTDFVKQKIVLQKSFGLQPVSVGFKIKIAEEKGVIPSTAFLGELSIPILSSKIYKSTYPAPAFVFSMQNTLSKHVSIGYNIGSEWNGETAEPSLVYTLTTGFDFIKNIGGFVEIFGFAPEKNIAENYFDCGINYLVQNNIMIDVSGGIGLNKNASAYFFGVGFSFRLKD